MRHCAPRGCGSATRTRRDLHEANGERGSRPASSLLAARPALAVAPEPARHLRVDPRQCPRAHALPPGGPVGAPDPRVSVRARNHFTGMQRLAGLRPSSQRHRAPVPQPNHAHEDYSPTQLLPGCPPTPPHASGILTFGNSVERPSITWVVRAYPAPDHISS